MVSPVRPFGILIVCAVLAVVACAPQSAVTSGNAVEFTDEGATMQSGYAGTAPKVELRNDAGKWLVTVYQGQKNTGGYAIRVEKLTVGGTILRVRARFTAPGPSDIVTQALTSPAHTIGIPFGADEVILFDQDDVERARFVR